MKKLGWVVVAVGIGLAGAWGYGALVRQEDDVTGPIRLLAIAEEQSLDLSFSRSGRIMSRVPDEGETVPAGALVARIEQPGLAEEALDYQRQQVEIGAREQSRVQEVEKARAELAQLASEEKRIGRLVREGIAAAADLESLQHRREAVEAGIRGREAEKRLLKAQEGTLEARVGKVERFQKEGVLRSPVAGTVLTRHHREGEWVEGGIPILTLQVETPHLRVEVPEERLSAFPVGATVRVWPQARPQSTFSAKVVSIKPRSDFATRKNWGLQGRDLATFSVRLAPEGASVVSGQTFVVEAGRG